VTIDSVRYLLALVMITTFPPAVGWWYLTHPLVGFWRRVGRPRFYTVLAVSSIAVIAGMYAIREPLLGCRKHLKLKILVGVPELAPDGRGGELITQGIYGRIRHPRYMAVWLGTVAVALFANYLAVYVLALVLVPALYLVVVLEERELRERFGEDYVTYSQRVPRFIPWRGE
jgi:protein-S-isoprenylcysteine O-methyltransferase Ste14